MKCKIKKTGFFLVLGILLIGAMPVKSQTNLYVYGTNGSKQTFLLSDVRKLTFTGTELLVVKKQSGETSPFLFANLRLFSLKDVIVTGIGTTIPSGDKIGKVYTETGAIILKGFDANASTTIYGLMGNKIADFKSINGDKTINVPNGIYIVKVQDTCYKVLVK
jgi:hypothetical protein